MANLMYFTHAWLMLSERILRSMSSTGFVKISTTKPETATEIAKVTTNSVINKANPPLPRAHGKYGCASVLSTNFRKPASTAGCVNSSQKISIRSEEHTSELQSR